MFLQNITQEQIEQFRQAFALFDKDGDGCISNKQLKTVLRSLGHNPSQEELELFTSLIDEDHSGTIDFRQFITLISQSLNQKTLFDEIVQALSVEDADCDGKLPRSLIRGVIIKDGLGRNRVGDSGNGTNNGGENGNSNNNHTIAMSTEEVLDRIDDIMDELDQQGDGLISIADFVTAMVKLQ